MLGLVAIPAGFFPLGLWAPLSALALLFGIAALGLAMIKPNRYGGRGIAIGAIAVSTVLLATGVSFFLYHAGKARDAASQAVALSNLLQIGKGLLAYAHANGGVFPDQLQALVEDGYCRPRALLDPLSGRDVPACDYFYVVGLTQRDWDLATDWEVLGGRRAERADWIIVYSDPAFHEHKGAFVLYLTGGARFVEEPQFLQDMRRFRESFERDRGAPPSVVEPR